MCRATAAQSDVVRDSTFSYTVKTQVTTRSFGPEAFSNSRQQFALFRNSLYLRRLPWLTECKSSSCGLVISEQLEILHTQTNARGFRQSGARFSSECEKLRISQQSTNRFRNLVQAFSFEMCKPADFAIVRETPTAGQYLRNFHRSKFCSAKKRP